MKNIGTKDNSLISFQSYEFLKTVFIKYQSPVNSLVANMKKKQLKDRI